MTDLLAALKELHGRRWLQPEEADRLIREGKQVIVLTGADRRKYVEAMKAEKRPS